MTAETINKTQNQIIEEFSLFPEWMEKYQYLLDMGEQLPLIEEKYKTDKSLVSSCQSKSWLHAEKVDNKVLLTADCDALIGKGIIALLIRVLSGHSAREIVEADLFFLQEIGLQEHLSMSRANGLESMILKIKSEAAAVEAVQDEK